MTNPTESDRAKFVRVTAPKGEIQVHFNPVSLKYAITNTLENKGKGNSKKQYVSQSTGKLTMDLIFDTTHNGEDVRVHTEKIAKFMEPQDPKSKKLENRVPAIVQFEWGLYKFQGMVEAYTETIDFFAGNGVPLRATINLTLASQDKVFEAGDTSGRADTAGSLGDLGVDAVEVPTGRPGSDEPLDGEAGGGSTSLGNGAAAIAAQGGLAGAAREIGALNGQESLRFGSGASLMVSGAVELGPPVAFASGAAGVGLGAGLQLGGGVEGALGVSAGVSAGLGAVAEAGVSARADFGGKASAGVSASEGAFAGLHHGPTKRRIGRIDTNRFFAPNPTAAAGVGEREGFRVGGAVTLGGSASLRADVGQKSSLGTRIQFQED